MRIEALNTNETQILTKNEIKAVQEESDESIFTQKAQVIQDEQVEIVEQEQKQEKVGWGEAFSLIGKGIVNKVKSMVTSVVKHPVATLATVALTAGAIAAAPLIGISSAVAGSILAIGFAGYAIFNTGKDVVETIKDNNAGRYDEVREDLGEIGGDAVDLALSLPFLPKALKTVKTAVKYGPKIGLNKALISDLKNGEGIYKSFKKADIGIQYETIGNQMGLKVKPELKFAKMSENMAGEFEPTTGTLKLSDDYLNPVGNFKKTVLGKMDSSTVLGHELTHYKQFLEIAQAYGPEGLQAAITEYYSTVLKNNGAETVAPKADWDDHYEKNRQAREGKTDALTAMKNSNKATTQAEKTYWDNQFDDAIQRIENSNAESELILAKQETYYNALDKVNAQGLDRYLVENMTNGDKSTFNAEFYAKALDSMSDAAADSAKASEYVNAFVQKANGVDEATAQAISEKYNLTFADSLLKTGNYRKAQLEAYKSNLLETEAYAAQGAYSQTSIPNELIATSIFNEQIEESDDPRTLGDVILDSTGIGIWKRVFD